MFADSYLDLDINYAQSSLSNIHQNSLDRACDYVYTATITVLYQLTVIPLLKTWAFIFQTIVYYAFRGVHLLKAMRLSYIIAHACTHLTTPV